MAWGWVQARLHQLLRQHPWLPPHGSLLIGVSGGQDSLCLLRLLIDLQPHWHWSLQVVHCNHGWREDAQANAEFVQTLSETWGVTCRVAIAPPEIKTQKTEAAARAWRYQVFTEMAQGQNCSHVVTGHTASDQAETVLLNLLRGSGLDGLSSLTWQRSLTPEISLVRPLLWITRDETASFCQGQGISPWPDATNEQLTYRRNRIRQELIPYLQEHFNAQVEPALARTSDLLQGDREYLEAQALALRLTLEQSHPPGLHRVMLGQAHLALQRRVVRQFLQQHLSRRSNYAQIAKFLHLLTAPNHSQTDPFPGGAIARVDHPWIQLIFP
ncbi:tRNA lysidine(34) synthetase TilS [Candidatus Synechococcus calcipolaris G9]|uniref:tRNA(Ile)-lysidine synthase n=1 Tax=Candidatus Synechococcus calcipolaris G9 TaxID=1497997 RepID=A0ABT6EXH1_9SYNE|nr:tRNA lysidine(34) synthetase TilS [Candidatus Synechococcus calcipolaris]MDG2989808.1 tRNA lysidine(34) synthetase TilS [Candidatus Synechococcus calcipolaris G9]